MRTGRSSPCCTNAVTTTACRASGADGSWLAVVVGGTVSRLSSGMFWHPRVDTVIQPLAPFVGPEGPEYDPVVVWDTIKDGVKDYLDVFGRPDQVSAWQEARPYVAAVVDA